MTEQQAARIIRLLEDIKSNTEEIPDIHLAVAQIRDRLTLEGLDEDTSG